MKPTYEELECRLAALAAENAGLKGAKEIIRHLNVNREEANFCGIDDCHIDDAIEAMITPATDRFIADVKAQGVEAFADKCRDKVRQSISLAVSDSWCVTWEHANEFAQQLREAK